MKVCIALVALFVACAAQQLREVQRPRPIAILSQSQDQTLDGSFSFGYQSEDGTSAGATGRVLQLGPEEAATIVEGSYSYIAPDGTPITTSYVADQTGFHVRGAHIPPEIQDLPGSQPGPAQQAVRVSSPQQRQQ